MTVVFGVCTFGTKESSVENHATRGHVHRGIRVKEAGEDINGKYQRRDL